MTEFLLVRHASHDLLGHRLAGRMPGVLLSARGRAEAERLALRLALEPARALATSPRERCLETAAPIAHAMGLRPIVQDSLDEIDFGEWTGRTFTDLDQEPAWRSFDERRSAWHAPGGETMARVERRVIDGLATLHEEHDGGRVIVVSHGDVLRAAVAHVLGVGLDGLLRFEIDPASITTLRWWGAGRATLVALNERPDVAAHPEPSLPPTEITP